MKGPLDPTEPPFPIRPNEPPCQYYLKHGTCKFGQACKFHHPPQHAIATTLAGGSTALGGPSVVLNAGGGLAVDAGGIQQPVFLSTSGTEGGGSGSTAAVVVQFLPQRPNEPDCIYFLRNGRCKYGATCRYHHPLSFPQQQQVEIISTGSSRFQHQPAHGVQMYPQTQPVGTGNRGRSHSTGSASDSTTNLLGSSLHLVAQPVQRGAGHGHFGALGQQLRVVPGSGGGMAHVLVPDGPVAVMSTTHQGGQSNSFNTIHHHTTGGNADVGANQGGVSSHLYSQSSSTMQISTPRQGTNAKVTSSPVLASSSVASSYETAASGFEYMSSSNASKRHHKQLSTDSAGMNWHRSLSQQQLSSFGTDEHNMSGIAGNVGAFAVAESSTQRRGHFQSTGRSSLVASGNENVSGYSQHHTGSSIRRPLEVASARNRQESRLRASSFGGVGEGGTTGASILQSSSQDATALRGWHSSASLSGQQGGAGMGSPYKEGNEHVSRQESHGRDPHYMSQSSRIFASSSGDSLSEYEESVQQNDPVPSVAQGHKHGSVGNSRRSQQSKERSSSGDVDGLSMMTSALLNMLDTHDQHPNSDNSSHPVNKDSSSSSHCHASSAPSTPGHEPRNLAPLSSSASDEIAAQATSSLGGVPPQHGALSQFSQSSLPSNSLLQVPGERDASPDFPYPPHNQRLIGAFQADVDDFESCHEDPATPVKASGQASRWSPTWRGARSAGQQLERNAQSVSALQPPPGAPAASHSSHNVGLFL